MPSDPLTQLAKVHDATGQLVEAVRDDQWGSPTPCSEWDVRALVNHIVAGDLLIFRRVSTLENVSKAAEVCWAILPSP